MERSRSTPGRALERRYPRHYTSLSPLLVLVPADEVEVRRAAGVGRGRQLGADGGRPGWFGHRPGRGHGGHVGVAGLFLGPLRPLPGRRVPGRPVGRSQGDGVRRGHDDERAGARARGVPQLVRARRQARLRLRRLDRRGHGQLGHRVAPGGDGALPGRGRSVWTRSPACCSRSIPGAAARPGRRTRRGAGCSRAWLTWPEERPSSGPRWPPGTAPWGGAASTQDLARHLGEWCGQDLTPWWDRYVYGVDGDRGRRGKAAAVCTGCA